MTTHTRKSNEPPRRRRRRRPPRAAQRGLMLIEILVVVTIIGLIAGIVGVNVFHAMVDAQRKTARTQMSQISEALQLFHVRYHRFPTTAEGLEVLARPPRGGPPVMETVPADPWGKGYVYAYPAKERDRRFSLASAGPDGAMDTEDDVRP